MTLGYRVFVQLWETELLIGCYYGRVFSHLIIYFRGMADQKESVQKRDVTRKEQIQTEVFYCT